MEVFFPPLQPNKNFDLFILSKFGATDRNNLLNINAKLQQINSLLEKSNAFLREHKENTEEGKKAKNAFINKDNEVRKAFNEIINQNTDPFLQRTALDINYDEYKAFFLYTPDLKSKSTLDTIYSTLSVRERFASKPALTKTQLQAIGVAVKNANLNIQRVGASLELFNDSLFDDMQLGLINVSDVYQAKRIEMEYIHTRLKNLEANILFGDSLQQVIDAAKVSQSARTNRALDSARNSISAIRGAMRTNYNILQKGVNKVQQVTDDNEKILQLVTLVGTTIASDLKTAGGNVLFVDAGLTCIGVPSLQDQLVKIPRLFWGVNIYFRPIDKNTRRNRFPHRFEPPIQMGQQGPDYGIVTKWSVWQRLSLNIGLTQGKLPNTEFDNLYNNMSLLVGPAYRFKRAFKISAGLSLLNRTSKDPRESNKVITPGGYISFSTDIDFIQGLKDVTSLLLK
jgi:hypothetical protein